MRLSLPLFSVLILATVIQVTAAESECPAKWMTFDRPQGRWCVKVFFGTYTRDMSEAQCTKYKATLTGIQTDDERLQIAEAGRKEFIAANPNAHELGEAAIWLGAQRNSSCSAYGVCEAKNVFQWTDGFTTGTDGFTFVPGQPDLSNSQVYGGVESCLQQYIFYSGNTWSTLPGVAFGALVDNWCTETRDPMSRLFACGKKPSA